MGRRSDFGMRFGRIKYSQLFNICNQQEWEVSRVLENGQINLTFRRNFDAPEWGMDRARE
jgi:hypothetical protein